MTSLSRLLLQVKPLQEMCALENLERQLAECYCPKLQVEKLRSGKRIRGKTRFKKITKRSQSLWGAINTPIKHEY